MSDTWQDMPKFSSYFGTALHGATITWYNDPAASGKLIDYKNYMHIEFEQNLFSYAYIWYDADDVKDVKWFKGNYAYKQVSPAVTLYEAVTGNPTDFHAVEVATAPFITPSDLVFGLQFDNPVTGGTPAKDGVVVAMSTRIITGGTTMDGLIGYRTKSIYDLKPTEDYKVDGGYDSGDATCKLLTYDQTSPQDDAGDWERVNETEPAFGVARKGSMCSESWKIGESGWTCVKVKGRLRRKMIPSETVCDLTLDYFEYDVKMRMGVLAAVDGKFTEKVNFDKLRTTTGASSYLTLGAFVTGLLAYTF